MKPLPELVSDAELETHFEGEGITSHLYRNPDPTSRHQVIYAQVKWKRQEFIGQGGFATVWREKRVDEDSVRAVKQFHVEARECIRELLAMAVFSKPKYNRYFVQSLGWYEDTSRHLHIAMEYLPRGDMRQYLSKSPSLPETEVQQVICQVLEGLSLMHGHKFAHRDLKSGNILICSSPPEPWWVKIADFGLTKRAEEITADPSAPMGTSGYMAPELLDFLPGADKSSNKVAFPADMWALGEITFRMLAGRPVFDGPFPLMRYSERAMPFPDQPLKKVNASPASITFIKSLMDAVPGKRATAKQASLSEWSLLLSAQDVDLRSLIATKSMLPTENFPRPSFHDHSIREQVDLSRLRPPLPRTGRQPPLSRTGQRPSPPTTDRQQSEAAPCQKPSGTLGHSKSRPIQTEERVAAQGDTSALPFVKQPEAISKDPRVSDGTLSLGKENIPPLKVHATRNEGSKSPPVDRFIDPGLKTQELGQGIIHRLKIGECFHIDSKAPFGYLYAVSADGRSIATANPDAGYFTITTQNQEKKKIRVHSDNGNAPKIYALRWSPCRDIVAVNVREGGGTWTRPKKHVRFYNISGKFLWSTQAIKDGDYQIVSLSHHGGYVLTYDETSKSVRCYRISGGQCRFSFPLRSKVGKISFDGKNLTLFLKESFVMKTFPVRGWKVLTRPSCVTQLKHSKPSLKWAPYLCKWAPSLGIVVEFDNITSAIVRDTENNGVLLQVPTSGYMHAFSRDEKLLAVEYNSQEWGHHPLVKVWDIRERVPIPRSPGQDLTNDHQWRLLGSGNIKRLQFLDDGTLVVFGNVSENGQTLLQAESLGRYNVISDSSSIFSVASLASSASDLSDGILAPDLEPFENRDPCNESETSEDEEQNEVDGDDENVQNFIVPRTFLIESNALKLFRSQLKHFVSSSKKAGEQEPEQDEQVFNFQQEDSPQKGDSQEIYANENTEVYLQNACSQPESEGFADIGERGEKFLSSVSKLQMIAKSVIRGYSEAAAVASFSRKLFELEPVSKIHQATLMDLGESAFISGYNSILGSFYRNLLHQSEVSSICRVLLKSSNRTSIAHGIIRSVEDAESARHGVQLGKMPVIEESGNNTFLSNWLKGQQEHDQENTIYHTPRSDILDAATERVLSQSTESTQILIRELKLLTLTEKIRNFVKIAPKESIKVSSGDVTSFSNSLKCFIEESTQHEWDWWPLAPPVHINHQNQYRIEWKFCGRVMHSNIAKPQALMIQELLDSLPDHSLQCGCCLPRQGLSWKARIELMASSLSHMFAKSMTGPSTPIQQSKAGMKYTPHGPPSSKSSSSLNSQSSSQNTSNTPGSGSSNTSMKVHAQGDGATQGASTNDADRIIFGVQGNRWSVEIEQIKVSDLSDDPAFFRELKLRYKKHRNWFKRLFSPFRFRHCRFVKFEKFDANRIVSQGDGLPDDHGFDCDYEYDPRPGKNPLIDPKTFAICLSACNADCKWPMFNPWHDCISLPCRSNRLKCIPKKKSDFDVISDDSGAIVWGLEAGYAMSFALLAVYHLIPIIAATAFWIYWLRTRTDDWQNAAVPILTVLALFAAFWMPFGKRLGVS